ncbi:hypothetical protein [Saccharicrinis sp. FJH54]|uniref:hypothetical protein n=1 Tax=Saccharicrinis sp. FJH54 TaxID=3344665 RepID=UPI0035D507FE
MNEKKLFNAKEELKDFDPSENYFNPVYCGPHKEVTIAAKFNMMDELAKAQYNAEVKYKIGDIVWSDVLIRSFDNNIGTYKIDKLGKGKIVDIFIEENTWKIRILHQMINNKRGKFWPHYTDIDLIDVKLEK